MKHVTYYVYLPHYVVTSDIIHVIHWTLRVTELISTHFTPDMDWWLLIQEC